MKKDYLKIGILFLVTVAAVFWALNYLFLSGKTAQKSKATGETIEVTHDPNATTVEAGKDFTVIVKMKPSTQIALRGYTLKYKFNKDILKVKYIDYKIGVPSPEFGNTSGTLTEVNNAGTINLQGEIQNETGLIMAGNSTVDLIRLVFTATTATGTTITTPPANFYLVESNATISVSTNNVPNYRVNGGTTAATCTNFTDNFSAAAINESKWDMTSTGTDSASGDFSIINDQAQISVSRTQGESKTNALITKNAVSGDFSTEVLLRSLTATGSASSGGSLTFSMAPTDSNEANHSINVIRKLGDSTLLTTKNSGSGSPVDQATANIGLTPQSPVKVKLERTDKNVKVFYDINDGQGYKLLKNFENVENVPVKFSFALSSFESVYPSVAARIDDFNLVCVASTSTPTPTPTGTTGGGTPTPTPTGTTGGGTPTPTPTNIPVTGNTVLDLKLKYQGIGSKPDDSRNLMTVKFTLSGADLATPLVKSGTFRSDANGVWTGKVGFDLTSPANKKYILYVKGPKHVQKKICDNAPSESAGGTYRCGTANMTLALGDNNKFDFSKVLLLSGDIYGPDKVQDGIVNSIDISYVKNNLRKTEASVLAICDINLDGKCDTQDYSLIISALSIKSDEL